MVEPREIATTFRREALGYARDLGRKLGMSEEEVRDQLIAEALELTALRDAETARKALAGRLLHEMKLEGEEG